MLFACILYIFFSTISHLDCQTITVRHKSSDIFSKLNNIPSVLISRSAFSFWFNFAGKHYSRRWYLLGWHKRLLGGWTACTVMRGKIHCGHHKLSIFAVGRSRNALFLKRNIPIWNDTLHPKLFVGPNCFLRQLLKFLSKIPV